MSKLIAVLAVMFSIDAAAQFEVSVEPAVVGRGEEYLHERENLCATLRLFLCPLKDEVRTNLRLLDEQAKTQRTVADTITALHQ